MGKGDGVLPRLRWISSKVWKREKGTGRGHFEEEGRERRKTSMDTISREDNSCVRGGSVLSHRGHGSIELFEISGYSTELSCCSSIDPPKISNYQHA